MAAKQKQAGGAPAASKSSSSPPPKKSAAKSAENKEGNVRVVDLANPGQPLMKVEARYDFEGNAAKDEMSFMKGDYITVYGKSKMDGWWVGRVQGEKKTLYFPYNYCKFVKKFN